MPRVETVVPENVDPIDPIDPPALLQYLRLRADQIQLNPVVAKARSGPVPANERIKIETLALSMRTLGQLVPCIVEEMPSTDGQYSLVDGWRRLQAARHINKTVDPGFELTCIVRARDHDGDSLQVAIHANLKRRGLSPLQFAYLCKELREMHGWKGTRELSDYLQVSRATISQHDKLLAKPKGMDEATYKDLMTKLASGGIAAEAAFEFLTHVEPTKAAEVLDKAAERAAESATEAAEPTEPSTTADEPANEPAGSNAQQSASQDKPKPKASSKDKPITRTHIRQAAQEAGAVIQPTSKGLPDLRKLFDQMRSATYPDVMRSFVSVLAEEWWRGDCKDKDVLHQWAQIANLVKQAQQLTARRSKRIG